MQFTIYRLTNTVNGKVYIGKTSTTVEDRVKSHLKEARGTTSQCAIHRAIRKYGIKKFMVDVIATTEDINKVDKLERAAIKKHDCCLLDGPDKGYNMTRGGEGFDSETVRVNNLLRVANGTHPWAGERGSKLNSATQRKLIAEGRHQFAGEKGSEFARKLIERRTKEGTNPWAGEQGSRHSHGVAMKLLAEGRHHSQQKQTCPHCGKVGAGNSMKKWHFDKCRFQNRSEVRDDLRGGRVETRHI